MPLRMAPGSLIIQNRYQLSDRELVKQIMENLYYQYFIGLPGYQDKPAFDTSTLVLFRKRITADMFNKANKYLLANKEEDQKKPTCSYKETAVLCTQGYRVPGRLPEPEPCAGYQGYPIAGNDL